MAITIGNATLEEEDLINQMLSAGKSDEEIQKAILERRGEDADPKAVTVSNATITGKIKDSRLGEALGGIFQEGLNLNLGLGKGTKLGNMSENGQQALSMGVKIGSAALDAVDDAFMGDKNFDAQSLAVDALADTAANMASLFGPWGQVASAAIKVANFTSKAVGQTTQGFDVDINSSGYGQLGHMEDKSNRDFGAMIGLGGLNPGKIDRQLANRNYLAQMALKASNVADTTRFEQEARMNAVDDVVRNNQIALAGGVDTSLLAAKQGAVLERKNPFKAIELDFVSRITKAQNGAKLENIETSDELNVLPTGELHKNLNHLDLDVTKKGIPVITVSDDSVSSFGQIKSLEDSLVQHCEVEAAEVIFNKLLTDFIENLRQLWHASGRKDNDLCKKAGMRLCKEILENTKDSGNVIDEVAARV